MKEEKIYRVVINACYGGFELSKEAVKWLEENAEDEKLRNYIKKDLSDCAVETESIEKCYEYVSIDLTYYLQRHHKDLIRCVEELGEKANGPSCKLAIIELNCPMYEIIDYDGSETVLEASSFGSFIIIDD